MVSECNRLWVVLWAGVNEQQFVGAAIMDPGTAEKERRPGGGT